MSTLPVWVQWLSALAMPTIALLGFWIGLQQWRLARRKIELDLFDRRFAVFEAAKRLGGNVAMESLDHPNAIFTFVRETKQARYLFGDDVVKFLGRLEKAAWKLRQARHTLANADHPQYAVAVDEEYEATTRLNDYFKQADAVFGSYLSVHGKRFLWD